jgi:hypothetical protein
LRPPKGQNQLSHSVLAGLDPAIHAFGRPKEDVDTRDKPAQDDYTLFTAQLAHALPEAGSPDSALRESGTPGGCLMPALAPP